MHGFVAVVAPEQWAAPGVEPIGPHLFGLVAREPNPDMQHYSLAANGAAEATGHAVLVACIPSERYRLCIAFRRGRPWHSFSPSAGEPDQDFAGLHSSYVSDPLAEGLSLAGFDPGLGLQLCALLGEHSHEASHDR